MLRKLLSAAAVGTLALFVTPALVTQQAFAEAPKCKNKANKYVACTDKLKAKTQRKGGRMDGFLEVEGIKGETEDRSRRGPRLKRR